MRVTLFTLFTLFTLNKWDDLDVRDEFIRLACALIADIEEYLGKVAALDAWEAERDA